MPYEENRPRAEAAHHIILEERVPAFRPRLE